MSKQPMAEAIAGYVEEVALFFEESGMPRTAGRILAHLLICDPPEMNAAQLAEATQASAGSVSTMTRVLLTAQLLEKVSFPGQRTTYYRIRRDSWEAMFIAKMGSLVAFRELADRGLALMANAGPERTDRLRDMRALHAFFEAEWPALLERWRAHRTNIDNAAKKAKTKKARSKAKTSRSKTKKARSKAKTSRSKTTATKKKITKKKTTKAAGRRKSRKGGAS